MIDSKLGNTIAHRLHIARVTEGQPADSDIDARPGHTITQAAEPSLLGWRLTNLDRPEMYYMGYIYPRNPSMGLTGSKCFGMRMDGPWLPDGLAQTEHTPPVPERGRQAS
jgi:hypothetical protein